MRHINPWLLAFIAVLCVAGIVSVEPENRLVWFLFVIPAAMIVWLLAHRKKT
jgi:uncharacterized membrane protein YjdF